MTMFVFNMFLNQISTKLSNNRWIYSTENWRHFRDNERESRWH